MRIFLIAALTGLLQVFVDGFSHPTKLAATRRQPMRSRAAAQSGHGAMHQMISNASFSIETSLESGRFGAFEPSWRRQLTCDPGFFVCPNELCCEVGTSCVEAGCCPGPHEACGAEGCFDPETETCCAAFSTYCKNPKVCVANGYCCPLGESLCGLDGCYDPKTEVCCSSTSTHCKKGHDCVTGGKCCPKNEVRCGTDGCYNPKMEVCCGDTSSLCDKGYDCVADDGCCPSGQHPCGASKCYNPKTDICCTQGAETWACNKDSRCCNLSLGCYNPETEKCCAAGVCPKSDSCCGKECCQSIATCGNDGRCTATKTATSTLKPTATTVPVLELPYTPLVLDETVKNMYLWMRTQPLAGPNEALLTYSIIRNDGGKCRGCCRGVTVPAGRLYAGDATSCDEAPFAKTYEALQSGASLACVDAYENSFQGWWFGQWVRYTRAMIPSFKDRSKFIVRVTGLDCSQVKRSDLQGCGSVAPVVPNPTPKRVMMRDSEGTPTSGFETQVIPSSVANYTNNLVIIPLGDLDVGTYTMQVTLLGSLSSVVILDNMGDDVGSSDAVSTSNLNSGSPFQFTISTAAIGVALVVETQQTKVNATWKFSASSSSTSPNSNPTSTNAATLVIVPGLASIMLLLASLFCLGLVSD